MKTIYTLVLILICSTGAFAQTGRQVSGVLKDTTGTTIIGATVKLTSPKDTLQASSGVDGSFAFRNVKSSQFVISISSIGFANTTRKFLYNDGPTPIALDPITVKSESKLLSTVTVTGQRTVVVKEDTLEYRAADYKLQANAVTEDLIKKLPGVEVDKDGNVTAQGKSVTRVKVNGKDYFGGDLQTATKNLPADLIERIQVVDDYGDQANITGSRTGDAEKIINITIRPDRNKGFFANGTAGIGNEGRYQLLLNGNYFNNTRQIAVLANLNNTNTSIFNNGNGGGGSFGGGGGNRGNRNRGGGGFGSDGITEVGSFGFNYRDQWGPKLSSYGTYNYFNRNNDVQAIVDQTIGTIAIKQNNVTNNISDNHRFNWNLEYQADSLNFLKFSPYLTYTKTTTDGVVNLIQTGNAEVNNLTQRNKTDNGVTTPNYGANLLFNHRFVKRGRNVSLNLAINRGQTLGDQYTDINGVYTTYPAGVFVSDTLQNQYVNTDNSSIGASSRFLYIEPISKSATLELNWDYNYTKYDNARETFDLLKASARVDTLSNVYNYSFASNNFGLTYRYVAAKFNYSLGLSGQPTALDGESISTGITSHRTAFNLVPIARFTYKFSRSKEFNLFYYGRNQEPSYTQIQPVPDRTNANFPIFGNPDLNAEFSNNINLRYNTSNFQTGRSFFTFISANFTRDKIVSNIVERRTDKKAVQETRYLNTDGYFMLNGFYSFSFPIKQKKYTIGYSGSGNYSNNPSFRNGVENLGRNMVLNQRLRLQINPVTNVEINPSASYSFNRLENTLAALSQNNSSVSTYSFGADSRVTFLKSWVIGEDFSKNINTGYSNSALNTSPKILNLYLEKQFFKDKRGTLRFQGYDLFNENLNVSRVVNGNITTDTRSNRLGRYFLLSFTMKIQKFSGVKPDMDQQQQGPGNFRRGEGRGEGRPPGM